MQALTRDEAEKAIRAALERPSRRLLVLDASPDDFPTYSDVIVDLSARETMTVYRALDEHFRLGSALVLLVSDMRRAVKLPADLLSRFETVRVLGGTTVAQPDVAEAA